MRNIIRPGLYALPLLLARPVRAEMTEATPTYIYQWGGLGEPSAVSLEAETAYGTREAAPFGEDGVEQRLRTRAQLGRRVMIEAWGGGLFDTSDGEKEVENDASRRETLYAYGAEANVGVVSQRDLGFNLSVGAGWLRDYEEVNAIRLRATPSRSWGRYDLTLTGLAEIPLGASNRDTTDVMFGFATSYLLTDDLRMGLEALGQDLEGFWEDEEAEGGARAIIGPTAIIDLDSALSLKLNASGVWVLTDNAPTRVADEDIPPNDPGFVGRLVLSYVF